jgi:hypothetical protein
MSSVSPDSLAATVAGTGFSGARVVSKPAALRFAAEVAPRSLEVQRPQLAEVPPADAETFVEVCITPTASTRSQYGSSVASTISVILRRPARIRSRRL